MNIDPSTTKYLIQARLEAEGMVEDTRVTKRNKIIERARSLLSSMVEESKTSGSDLLDEVRQSVQVSEIVSFGAERLAAGPNVADSDAIIIVEGRQDVLNLLRSGIKNAIAVEGTNVPKTIQELSKERALTAFVDGDRGGDLILKELLQVAEVDFIARAPRGKEVEELTQKQIMKCLRNKIPADQYVEMYGLSGQVYKAESDDPLKTAKQPSAVVFDGIITQRILDIASEMNMHSIVGTKMGTITKQPAGVEVWTRSDLAP